MAAQAIAGLGAALGGILGAFGNQSRVPAGGSGRRVDTSTAAIAAAPDRKSQKAAAKNAQAERIHDILTDPQVMGAMVTVGGLLLASRVPFHPDPEVNARVQGLAGASCVLMGLGRAGVGDLTSLTMAALAGATLGLADGGGAGGSRRSPLTVYLPGTDIPLASAWGPIPSLQYLYGKVTD